MVEAGVPGAVVVGVFTEEEDEVVEGLTEVEAEVSTEGEVVEVGVSVEVEVEDVEDLHGAAVDLREEDTIRVLAALVLCPTWPHQNTRFIHCNKIILFSLICVFI